MKLKRILFCVVSAAIAVSATMFSFVGNSTTEKQAIKEDTNNQLVLTQAGDLVSDSYLLARHGSHCSHRSHSSHSSHYSCC